MAQHNVDFGQKLFLSNPDFRVLSLQSQALISELGFVLGSPSSEFVAACKRPKFCDIVKAFHARKSADLAQLCREIYLRNRKHSRYVRRSYTDQ